MSENENIDLNIIADKCQIATGTNYADIICNLEQLKSNYTDIELIAIYNCFLQKEFVPEVLVYLLKELDKYRDSSSLDIITELLLMRVPIKNSTYAKEDYTNVRVICAKVISNFKDHRSVFPLLYCLNNKDDNYKVRLSCADALGRLGDKYAVTPLIDVVTDESEKSVYIRESAAAALGALGDVRAMDSLVSILETKNGLMDKFTYLKERVIEALGKLNHNNDRAFKALKNSLYDENPQVRINAIEAIMNYDSEESLELIKKMLKDADEEVARNAVIALYNIDGELALKEILEGDDISPACKDEAQKIWEDEIEENENSYD